MDHFGKQAHHPRRIISTHLDHFPISKISSGVVVLVDVIIIDITFSAIIIFKSMICIFVVNDTVTVILCSLLLTCCRRQNAAHSPSSRRRQGAENAGEEIIERWMLGLLVGSRAVHNGGRPPVVLSSFRKRPN